MVLTGREVVVKMEEKISNEIRKIDDFRLEVLIVGSDEASNKYLNAKVKLCEKLGIKINVTKLDESISQEELVSKVRKISNNGCAGFILENPLPKKFNKTSVLDAINPKVDMDCLTSYNQGKLFTKDAIVYPATAKAVEVMLDYYNIDIQSKNVVILGRSIVVGRPLSMLMLNRDATVTVAHSKTNNLYDITKNADILISAIGVPNFVKKDMVKKDAVIIDVGINVVDGKIVGDCDYKNLENFVDSITPVPGGVGVITNRVLIMNVIELFRRK